MVKKLTPIAFLFDLDGVLIDSETEYTKIWSEINHRFPSGYDDLAFRIKGMTLDNIMKTYYPDESTDKTIRNLLHEMESKMTYRWLPGAKEMLQWLDNKGIPHVLVTSSDDKKMEHLREEIPELESMFTFIVTANLITRSKPDPEGYLLGAGEVGVRPENCVVFEDSLQGVKAGRNSGAYVTGVAGTLPASTIEPYCDRVVSTLEGFDMEEICEILRHR